MVSQVLYALPAWGWFMSKELTDRIDAFLKDLIAMALLQLLLM